MNEENLRLILGLKLRQFRSSKNLSLKKLSGLAGMSVSYLNEIEKGKKYPKGDKLIALANALEVPYDELVSMKLNHGLSPLGDLLSSNIIQRLPLNIFGLDSTDMMSLMSDTPRKFSSLISTIIEFARKYDMKMDQFFFTTMRSYQEMHHNYFADLEAEAVKLRDQLFDKNPLDIEVSDLITLLTSNYGYTIDLEQLAEEKELKHYRTVFLPEQKKLLVNPALTSNQQRFSLAKELGYAWLGIEQRALTSSWLKVSKFEHVFNNFRASYVAGALIMPEKEMISDLRVFFGKTGWEPGSLNELLIKYKATPEMLGYRFTELIPEHLGLKNIYFLRFFSDDGEDRYHLNKEMHFTKLHSPHGVILNEHYCQRWVSTKSLDELKSNKTAHSDPDFIQIRAQRSSFWNTSNEYLNISMARSLSLKPSINSCVTIGFALDKQSKSKIKFWNDAALQVQNVGETCERCGIEDCDVRASEPHILKKEQFYERSLNALDTLRNIND